MKRIISILLVTVMLVAMIPAAAVTAGADVAAETPAATGKWTDAGNYDLSWAEPLVTDTAKDGESCTVDGKIYTLKYHVGVYEIDTPAKLAGVAVLANSVPGESFSGTVFKITAEIDLGAHLWIPIGKDDAHKFRGTIIADTEGVISNMTIVDTASATDSCYGLVGHQGNGQGCGEYGATGTIRNITLKNATINVTNGYVGSFVGRITYGGNDYMNIKSDAKIVCSSGKNGSTYVEHGNAWNAVGGICGRVDGWGQLNQKFVGCVFTGSIDAPTASCVGGIVGVDRRSDISILTVDKCVVAVEFIRYGAYRPGGEAAWYGGCGGFVGADINADGGTTVINESYVAAGEFTIYLEQNGSAGHDGTAGAIGNCNDHTFTNVQIDMVSAGDGARHHGVYVGRGMGAVKFESCVNTGMFVRTKGASWNGADTFNWHARNPGYTSNGKNFGTFAQRLVYGVDADAPTVIEGVDTWKTALDSTIWSEREGSIYPILTIAKDYDKYSVSGANVDYSFFNIAGCKVTTTAELNALNFIAQAMGNYADETLAIDGVNADRVRIAPTMAAADISGMSANAQALVNAELGKLEDVEIDTEGAVFNMAKSFVQTSKDGKYVRFAILTNVKNLAAVDFEVALTSTRDGEVVFGDGWAYSEMIDVAYKQVVDVANEKTYVAAEEGGSEDWAYVVFVVRNVALTADVTFSVRANAILDVETSEYGVQSVTNNYTVKAVAN